MGTDRSSVIAATLKAAVTARVAKSSVTSAREWERFRPITETRLYQSAGCLREHCMETLDCPAAHTRRALSLCVQCESVKL